MRRIILIALIAVLLFFAHHYNVLGFAIRAMIGLAVAIITLRVVLRQIDEPVPDDDLRGAIINTVEIMAAGNHYEAAYPIASMRMWGCPKCESKYGELGGLHGRTDCSTWTCRTCLIRFYVYDPSQTQTLEPYVEPFIGLQTNLVPSPHPKA